MGATAVLTAGAFIGTFPPKISPPPSPIDVSPNQPYPPVTGAYHNAGERVAQQQERNAAAITRLRDTILTGSWGILDTQTLETPRTVQSGLDSVRHTKHLPVWLETRFPVPQFHVLPRHREVPEQRCRVCQCPISDSCTCIPDITKFFGLLQTVAQRVSSQNHGSEEVGLTGHACIDKLSFSLEVPLLKDELVTHVRSMNLSLRERRLRDRKWYLQIGSVGTYLRGHIGCETFDYIVSRPSAYRSFTDYFEHLQQVFGNDQLVSARFRRLDFAVDYPIELVEFLACLDVARKKTRTQFIDEGSNRTGVVVGRGQEKIVVYDKARESGRNGPLTRLEVQLSGSKLPARNFAGLMKLAEELDFRPFHCVQLASIRVPDRDELPNDKVRSRLQEFDFLLRNDGYLGARTKLQRDGNFERDYGRYLGRKAWTETPDEAVGRYLQSHFCGSRPN